MIVLGLNHSIDSAAALVEDGTVRAASAEERFSRIKHDAGFPHRAMNFVLGQGQRSWQACDAVAFFWNPIREMDAPNRRFTAHPRSHLEYMFSLPNHLLAGEDLSELPYVELSLPSGGGQGPQRLFYVDHHLCHAAHAFYESPFDEAAILTVDGYGERTSTLIARGRGTEITPLLRVNFPHSLGSVYAALTEYLGFRGNADEGKVMGLSSYGRPTYADFFRKLIWPTPEGFSVDLSYFAYFRDGPHRYSERLVEILGPARIAEEPLETRHEDIAASLQTVAEEILLHLAVLARKTSGLDALAMGGGVALNCVANGRIAKEAGLGRSFFQPACHDAGTSAGAALYVAHAILGEAKRSETRIADYLGPSFDADTIRNILRGAGLRYREPRDIADDAAERLARGRIIGRFAGRAEFGPRALGNRSIIAPPGPASVKDTVNRRVKGREVFRPFAPSVAEPQCGTYFDSAIPSPFMLRVYRTADAHVDKLGAITHVDGSARVQTVNREQNADYLDLIEAYGRKSGVHAVMNTSFNVRGEPIVHSPQDALKCFYTTDMDDLYLGPFALEK